MNAQVIATVVSLDIGMARTGVALANSVARIARPLCVIEGLEDLPMAVSGLIREHEAVALIIGLPRNLSGKDTEQTAIVRTQAERIAEKVAIPLYFTDEATTSLRAEEELKARKKPYNKGDIDMLAAVYILEDYASQHPEVYEVS